MSQSKSNQISLFTKHVNENEKWNFSCYTLEQGFSLICTSIRI